MARRRSLDPPRAAGRSRQPRWAGSAFRAPAGGRTSRRRASISPSSSAAGPARTASPPSTTRNSSPSRRHEPGSPTPPPPPRPAARPPFIRVEADGEARACPLAILMWHEIVNDTLGGVPIVVTFCPLCNTGLVFERELEGVVYDFGTTGNLRFSDLVMYDRQTESWWQQATGPAVVGVLTGSALVFEPSQIVSLGDMAAADPDAD